MKTTDLMLGSYVKVKPSGMIIKVAAIHKKKVGYHSCQSKLEWIRRDLIEPIPLTPEILEKNGFVKDDKNDNMYYWSWSIMNDCVSFDKETNVLRIFHTLGNLVFVHPLSYVHELQHALRLCAVKKEIVL